MRVLKVRNVHEALPRALRLLDEIGEERNSRNGLVLVAPCPVTTVYEKPLENVIFWPQRDANPFFHLYESLWMLAGRADVAPLCRYVKRSIEYSDDGTTLHGAYGMRWRDWFSVAGEGRVHLDQLATIAQILIKNPEDRRCILQMWDAESDLGRQGKDFPCNTMAAFQRGSQGELNLTVFCRSNDIVWGAYGANAVQFSTLLEYMAVWIGCPVGVLNQVSVNWHGYLDTLRGLESVQPDRLDFVDNPYIDRRVSHIDMPSDHDLLDRLIDKLLDIADAGAKIASGHEPGDPWAHMVYHVLRAHQVYKENSTHTRFGAALEILDRTDKKADWVVAAREWILRREKIAAAKTDIFSGDLGHG